MSEETPSLQGWEPPVATPAQLADALEKAVDYRGDVTLSLADGSTLVCFIFNREPGAADPFVDVYPADRNEKVRIPFRDIKDVRFTGRDTAAGKSWATYQAKKKAEAEGRKSDAAG